MTARNKRNRDFAETRTTLGVFGGILGLVLASAFAAVLVVVGATPALSMAGLAASGSIGMFDNLPDYLKIEAPSEKSDIYATRSDGTAVLLASFYEQNRVEVGWDQINQYVKDAVIAGEDPRFYDHGGVDLQGTLRAAVTTSTGRDTQGGSSIAQQYVKNVRVQECELLRDEIAKEECYDGVTETSIDRKLKEMRLAIGIEKRYAKNDILLGYLNIAGFGGTVYGIEAAASYYYSTTAANLTLPQAASLVAIVNNPAKFKIDDPGDPANGAANGYAENTARRAYILDRMLDEGKITQAEHDAAVATPVQPVINEPSTGCQTAGGSAFFCDYVASIVRTDPTFGATPEERDMNFRRGGYDIYTTLDLDLQNAAETAIATHVPQTYPGWDVGGVISSIEVGTGRVLAMAQNKIYSQDPEVQAQGPQFSGVNYNTDYAYGGSLGFQPGSTFKVYTLAQWVKEGHDLNERVDSRRKDNWGFFRDSCVGGVSAGNWNPANDANEAGANYTVLESTLGSINTGFVGMAKELDLCGIRQTAEAFGVHRADGQPFEPIASGVIGVEYVAPLSIANGMATIANNGVACTPIAIDRIVGRDGQEIPAPASTCQKVAEPDVIAKMNYALTRAVTNGTGAQSWQALSPKAPAIGKTGTTDGAKDTWMSGATTEVATAAGVVSVKGYANQRQLSFATGQAATARHRMWPAVMSVAAAKYGGGQFPEIAPGPVEAPPAPTPAPGAPGQPGQPGQPGTPPPGQAPPGQDGPDDD